MTNLKSLIVLCFFIISVPLSAFGGNEYDINFTNNTDKTISINPELDKITCTQSLSPDHLQLAPSQSLQWVWLTSESACDTAEIDYTVQFPDGSATIQSRANTYDGTYCITYNVTSLDSSGYVVTTSQGGQGHSNKTLNINICDSNNPSKCQTAALSADECPGGGEKL